MESFLFLVSHIVVRLMAPKHLPAQLAVQRAKTRCHECRQITIHYPLLKSHGLRSGFEYVKQAGSSEVPDSTLMMDVVDELVAQWKVLLLSHTGKVFALGFVPADRVASRGEPHRQDLWLQPDLGCDSKEQLDDVCFDILSDSHCAGTHSPIYEVHEGHGEDIVLQEVLLFAFDERTVEVDGISHDTLVIRSRCDLGYAGVYLLCCSKLEAEVRRGRSRLIVEYVGQGLDSTANAGQRVAVVGEVLRLLPL
jgi:hypothetical protein